MASLFEQILPIRILVKLLIIILVAIMTTLGAYFVPKGKLFVILAGIIAILVIWYIDLEISI